MTDPSAVLQQLLGAGAVNQQSFGQESRYYGLPLRNYTAPDGSQVSYVSRRFIPQPGAFALLQRYRIEQGDRIDVVAAAAIGNPLSYWLICDANVVADPSEITAVPGAFILITLPAAVPGG